MHSCLILSRITPTSVCIRDAKEAFSVKPRFADDFAYLVLDVEDSEEQNLIRLIPGYEISYSSVPQSNLKFYLARKPSLITRYNQVAESSFTVTVRSSISILGHQSANTQAGGISLSPAFVVMFVMEHYQLSWEDALHMVQNRRYCISPNGGFLTQIKASYKNGRHIPII